MKSEGFSNLVPAFYKIFGPKPCARKSSRGLISGKRVTTNILCNQGLLAFEYIICDIITCMNLSETQNVSNIKF